MLVLPLEAPHNLQRWALPSMVNLNVFTLLNAFTGSFISYFRLFRCFDSIRNSFNFALQFVFDLSGIFVYLLSLRSEGGCETDKTNDCAQVNLFNNNGSVLNFTLLRYVSFITVTVNPRGIYRMTASTALTTVAPSTQRCKAYERSCAK